MKSMFNVLKEDLRELVEDVKPVFRLFGSMFQLSKTRQDLMVKLVPRVLFSYVIAMFLFIQFNVSIMYVFYLMFGLFVVSYLEDVYIRSRKAEEEAIEE